MKTETCIPMECHSLHDGHHRLAAAAKLGLPIRIGDNLWYPEAARTRCNGCGCRFIVVTQYADGTEFICPHCGGHRTAKGGGQ